MFELREIGISSHAAECMLVFVVIADLVSTAFIALDIPDGNAVARWNNDINCVSGRGGEPDTLSCAGDHGRRFEIPGVLGAEICQAT
jgi:hypothetical protein